MAKKPKLNDIIKCCENRFSRGLSTDWKNSDFIDLSREILRDTDVNISPNTLKRIFGKIAVDEDYLPQLATIEALKKYGGYVASTMKEPIVEQDVEQPIIVSKPITPKKYKPLLLISVTFIVVAGFLFFKILKPNSKLSASIIQTSTEGLLPATVFFDIQLPESKDSLFVNFGDKSAMVFIAKGQQKVAHNYLFPDVFDVHLQTRQQKLSSTKVYVRSNKWIGFGFHNLINLRNSHYEFPAVKNGKDSLFNISNQQLYKAGLDTTERTYIRLCNYTPTGYDSDNFVFETAFKNAVHKEGISCQSTQFQIAGTNSNIRFKLSNSGCTYWVMNIVSERVFDGSKTNLSQFVFDPEKWNDVKLINQNKHLYLWVNGKKIFNGTYQKPLGEIKGLFLEFEGNGFVKNCDLKTNEGKMLYHF